MDEAIRVEDIKRRLASGAPVASGDDRYAVACGIADGCGLTKALGEPSAKETPHLCILYAMSGMVLAGEFELLKDLRQHAMEPGYFSPISDSHYVVATRRWCSGSLLT